MRRELASCAAKVAAILLLAVFGWSYVQSAHADSRDDQGGIELKLIGRYSSGIFGDGAAESLTYDPKTQRVFVVNVANATVDVVDISDPTQPLFLFAINVAPFGAHATSAAVHKGVVAIAVPSANNDQTDPGKAVFFDTDGKFLSAVEVGALPDMITFTPDGKKVLVANEGQPNQAYTIDPEGSVSIIDISQGAHNVTQADVVTADFKAFNNKKLDPSIRIFGPNATVAQDLEPEYIAVSHDSKEAWVTLQENNAIAHLDIRRGVFTKLMGLGFKNHNRRDNELDASDRDGLINIKKWPVKGMYQPDGIATYRYKGEIFLVTANEGDARDYDGFAEEARVSSLKLDGTAFPDAAIFNFPRIWGGLPLPRQRATRTKTDSSKSFMPLGRGPFRYGPSQVGWFSTAGTILSGLPQTVSRMTSTLTTKRMTPLIVGVTIRGPSRKMSRLRNSLVALMHLSAWRESGGSWFMTSLTLMMFLS